MNTLELKVPPLVLVLLIAGAMWFAVRQLPSLTFTLPWSDGLAVTVFGGGILLMVAGFFEFQKARTSFNPMKPDAASSVVTSGIYRVSRNPMYVGFLLMLISWAIFLSHPLPFLLLPVFVAYMNRFQILPEERALSAKFGGEYEAYKHNVRRWL